MGVTIHRVLFGTVVLFAALAANGDGAARLLFRNGDPLEGRRVAVYRIPAVGAWSDGSLVAVSDARYDNAEDLSEKYPIVIACRRSSDGGLTWSEPSVVWKCPWNETEKWSASDASLVVDAQTGAVFCFVNAMEHVRNAGTPYRHFVQRSDDRGATWGKPVEITGALRLPHWKTDSPALITSGRGVQLRDGTLVHTMTCDDEVCLFASTDHGASWKPFGRPSSHGNECKVAELDDGTLIIDSRVGVPAGGRWVHVSHDRGQTWKFHHDMGRPDPKCNAALNLLPVKGRNRLAFSNCSNWGVRNSLTLRTSGDGGTTWSEGILIDRDDGGYSELVPLPNGAAGIVWERMKTGLTYFRRIEASELERDAAHPPCRLEDDDLPCCTQRLAVAFSSAEAAQRATAEVKRMPFGKKSAFSTRWDDANPRHEKMAATLNPLGVYATFYVNGRPDEKFCTLMRKLVADGNSIGAHSISHVFMERLLPSVSFREILENRIVLEVGSQSPVSTFTLPYSNAAAEADEFAERRVGLAAAQAGLMGGAESRRDIAGRFGLSEKRWCASYTFRANDRNPSRKEFDSKFGWGQQLCERGTLPCGPHTTFGVHTWQSDEGLKEVGAFVGRIAHRDDIWYVNENTYAAYRRQALNTTVRKTKTIGNKALFEIVRPKPHALGAAVDLHMTLSENPQELKLEDGALLPTTAQVCLKAPDTLPTRYERLERGLSVGDDLETFRFDFANPSADELSEIEMSLRLPPGYEPGVVRTSCPRLAPGARVSRTWRAKRPQDPLLREGKLFAAVQVDARTRAERVRYWATLLRARMSERRAVPRDTACVCGPVRADEVPAEGRLAQASLPRAELPDVPGATFGTWRRTVADTSEADYAIAVPSSDERIDVRNAMRAEKGAKTLLLAFDFKTDVARDGTLWRLAFKARGLAKDRQVRMFLNGAPFVPAEGGLFEPRSGDNRLVLAFENGSEAPFLQELSVKSVPGGVSAAFAPAVLPDSQIGRFDPLMAEQTAVIDEKGVKWIDGRNLPLEGRAFDDTEHYYDRLPANVTTNVNAGVRTMKHHTSGMLFRFTTDSKRLSFKWVPYSRSLEMDHMPATGVSGIDVYRYDAKAGRWRYVKTGFISSEKGAALSVPWVPGTPCLVHLPLYNGIRSFSLGIDKAAHVQALPPRKSGIVKPVVFYGTSITHGGCCSRPGMSFVNIVGRTCDVPVVNLGFSGSGRMELEMSEHLARIDASCYVLDCTWNMTSRAAGDKPGFTVEENFEPFIRNLRTKRPNVPIIIAESCDVYFGESPRSSHHQAKDRFIRGVYDKLVAEGWKHLYWLPKDRMYAGDFEGTVDGSHPNDYGMMMLAAAYGKAVKTALGMK